MATVRVSSLCGKAQGLTDNRDAALMADTRQEHYSFELGLNLASVAQSLLARSLSYAAYGRASVGRPALNCFSCLGLELRAASAL